MTELRMRAQRRIVKSGEMTKTRRDAETEVSRACME